MKNNTLLFFITLIILSEATQIRKVAFVNQISSWWPQEKIAASIGTPGFAVETAYNYFSYGYWEPYGTSNIADIWYKPTYYMTENSVFGISDDEIRGTILASFKAKGIKTLVTAYGSHYPPTTFQQNAVQNAQKLAEYVKRIGFDGVIIQYADTSAFMAGTAEDWLADLTRELRTQLGDDYIIAHAPNAHYFQKDSHPGGGYLSVHQKIGDAIDFYVIQFFNTYNAKYTTFDELFISAFKETAIKQIVESGIPVQKIVIGKPASQANAYGPGYIQASTANQLLLKAKQDYGMTMSYALWEYKSDSDGSIIESIYKDFPQEIQLQSDENNGNVVNDNAQNVEQTGSDENKEENAIDGSVQNTETVVEYQHIGNIGIDENNVKKEIVQGAEDTQKPQNVPSVQQIENNQNIEFRQNPKSIDNAQGTNQNEEDMKDVQNTGSEQKIANQQNLQDTQIGQNKQDAQKVESIKKAQERINNEGTKEVKQTENINTTEKTETKEITQNTENTVKTQNNEKTQNTETKEITQNTENTEKIDKPLIVDNEKNAQIPDNVQIQDKQIQNNEINQNQVKDYDIETSHPENNPAFEQQNDTEKNNLTVEPEAGLAPLETNQNNSNLNIKDTNQSVQITQTEQNGESTTTDQNQHQSVVVSSKMVYPIKFTYINMIKSWASAAKIAEGMGVPGYAPENQYNYIALSFWQSNQLKNFAKVWQNPVTYFGDRTQFGSTNQQIRRFIIDKYHGAGKKLLISAFGANDYPTYFNSTDSNGAKIKSIRNASQMAQALGQYVVSNILDGVDIDYEESDAFKMQDGEQWLIQFTKTLHAYLKERGQYIISHAPQAPYFYNHPVHVQYPKGGYIKVNQQVGHLIDFYNVQFYNQQVTTYDTYESLFKVANGWQYGTSVKQINDVGVALEKIVIGKPATLQNAYNTGFVEAATLSQFLQQGKDEFGWNAGVMVWQYLGDLDGTFIQKCTQNL